MKPKFRIIEKTTLSGKKCFVPQVGLYICMGTSGYLWWKQPFYEYAYYGLKPLPENGIMIEFNSINMNKGEGFDSLNEAIEYLNKFKAILRNDSDKEKDRLFQEEIKIIDIY